MELIPSHGSRGATPSWCLPAPWLCCLRHLLNLYVPISPNIRHPMASLWMSFLLSPHSLPCTLPWSCGFQHPLCGCVSLRSSWASTCKAASPLPCAPGFHPALSRHQGPLQPRVSAEHGSSEPPALPLTFFKFVLKCPLLNEFFLERPVQNCNPTLSLACPNRPSCLFSMSCVTETPVISFVMSCFSPHSTVPKLNVGGIRAFTGLSLVP